MRDEKKKRKAHGRHLEAFLETQNRRPAASESTFNPHDLYTHSNLEALVWDDPK